MPPPLLTPVVVDLGPALGEALAPGGQQSRLIDELVPALRDRLFEELGLPLPAVRLRLSAPGLGPDGYQLRLSEVAMASGRVAPRPEAAEAIAAHLLVLLRRHGFELLGIQETQSLLDALERTHPALVREVVPKVVSPALLTDVLRRLAEEGISLRALREILGALAEWAPLERDPVVLTEHVRTALRRQITARHASGGALAVHLLDPAVEEAIREAIHRTATGSYLALEPALSREILEAVGRAVKGEDAPVLLTSTDVRRYLRRLVEVEHPRVAVLSYPELPPELRLLPRPRVTVGASSSHQDSV